MADFLFLTYFIKKIQKATNIKSYKYKFRKLHLDSEIESYQMQPAYFFQVNLINFLPTQDQLKSMTKSSFLKVILSRQSNAPMFISDNQNIAQLKSYIKPFLYKGKISLGQQFLKFSVKASDLNQNQHFFVKIFVVNQQVQKLLAQCKILIKKYVQAKKVQNKAYFQQSFNSKNGSSIESQVFIEKNRAALENLISDQTSKNKKKRSQSVKRREARSPLQNQSLTIQKLYKLSMEQKNERKLQQKNELTKSSCQKLGKSSKTMKKSLLKTSQVRQVPEKLLQKNYSYNREDQIKQSGNQLTKMQKDGLNMSKVTQILNSQVQSSLQKSQNTYHSRSPERLLTKSQKTQIKPVMDNLQLQKLEKTLDLLQESRVPVKSQLEKKIESKISISSISSISSLTSRFSMEAIDMDSSQSIFAHSSQQSASSEIQVLHSRKRNIGYSLLLILAIFAIGYLLIPTDRISLSLKKNSKRNKSNRK